MADYMQTDWMDPLSQFTDALSVCVYEIDGGCRKEEVIVSVFGEMWWVGVRSP